MIDYRLTAIYLLVVNLVAMALYFADKRRATHGLWRIPERTLLLIALAGGSFGAYVAMQLAHHKTQKPVFGVGVPFMMMVHLALLSYLYIPR